MLSPALFTLFINELAGVFDCLDRGVTIGSEKVSIIMYADDIVLLSENEIAMQDVIKCCNQWCNEWHLEVNTDKSGVVHFYV